VKYTTQLTLGPNTNIHHNYKEIKSVWDDLACRDSLNALLNARSPWDKCRLLAALESHTTCWSEAFPIANVGNLISADELRITIAL